MRENLVLNFRKASGQLLRIQWLSSPAWYRRPTTSYRVSWIKVRVREELTQGRRSHEPPYIDLVFGTQVLEDSRTLKSYGIHSGSELTLVFLTPPMHLNLEYVTDVQTHQPWHGLGEARSTDSVDHFKAWIHSHHGTPVSRLRLFHRGIELIDGSQSLEAVPIRDGDTIHIHVGDHQGIYRTSMSRTYRATHRTSMSA